MPWLNFFCDPAAHCPSESSPVCGRDGVTYTNMCIALYQNCAPVACEGPCPCDPAGCDPGIGCAAVWDPVCGADGMTYGNACDAFHMGCTSVACEGWCPCGYGCMPSLSCPILAEPVCGIDGATYANPCAAECEPMPAACPGQCPCP